MNGQSRLIKGFKTSYRRMQWDKPASTLTMNSGVISSDTRTSRTNRVLLLGKFLYCPHWIIRNGDKNILLKELNLEDVIQKGVFPQN